VQWRLVGAPTWNNLYQPAGSGTDWRKHLAMNAATNFVEACYDALYNFAGARGAGVQEAGKKLCLQYGFVTQSYSIASSVLTGMPVDEAFRQVNLSSIVGTINQSLYAYFNSDPIFATAAACLSWRLSQDASEAMTIIAKWLYCSMDANGFIPYDVDLAPLVQEVNAGNEFSRKIAVWIDHQVDQLVHIMFMASSESVQPGEMAGEPECDEEPECESGYDWCADLDFTESDHGWFNTPEYPGGQWIAGLGWRSSEPVPEINDDPEVNIDAYLTASVGRFYTWIRSDVLPSGSIYRKHHMYFQQGGSYGWFTPSLKATGQTWEGHAGTFDVYGWDHQIDGGLPDPVVIDGGLRLRYATNNGNPNFIVARMQIAGYGTGGWG